MIEVDGLLTLLQLRRRPDRFRHQVSLVIPTLAAERLRTVERRLRAFQRDCGCSSGAIFLFAALLISLALLGIRHGWTSWGFLGRLPWALLVSFAAAGLGKSYGLVRARRRFDRELDLVIRTLT
jgi:hypothetical protein